MATGWNFHELYLWHDTGNAATFFPPGLTIEPGDHAENSATKRRFRNLVEACATASGGGDRRCRGSAQRSSPLNRRMTFSRMRDTGLS